MYLLSSLLFTWTQMASKCKVLTHILVLARVICTLILSPCQLSCPHFRALNSISLLPGTFFPDQQSYLPYHSGFNSKRGLPFMPPYSILSSYCTYSVWNSYVCTYVYVDFYFFHYNLSSSSPGHLSCLPLSSVLNIAPGPLQTHKWL